MGDMEGSGSASWTFVNAQTWIEVMGNDATLMENITDSHLPCEQIQEVFGQPLPIPISIENVLRYIQALYYVFNLVLGVFLNLFVIVLTLRFKRLQNVTFLLGFQVCVGDMLNSVITLPTSAANAIAGRFVLTGLCSLFGFGQFFLSLTRTYLMFVLVFDRFCTIFMPFWYLRHRIRMVLPLSLGAWMLAFIVALIPVKDLLDCYSVARSGWACFPSQGCKHQGECLTYVWTALILTNTSSVVSLIMYLILFCKARKLRNKVTIAHQPDASAEEENAATAQKLKRERRAHVTFFLLYLSLIGISLPPVIVLFIGRVIIFISGVALPTAYNVVQILAGSSFSLLVFIDPIVIMRNEDFKEVVKKVLNKIKAQTRNVTEVLSTFQSQV